MKIINLASGSSGNATVIKTAKTNILIDAGISRKRICDGLKEIDMTMNDIEYLLITHEHSDHIGGLGAVSRRDFLPIYGTLPTIKAIIAKRSLGKIEQFLFNPIEKGREFRLGDAVIMPVSTYHDAADSVGFVVKDDKHSIGILTDTGKYDRRMVEAFRGVDQILIETNHDINMLQVGSYPYELKRRILGNQGHLCNEAGAAFVCEIMEDGLKGVLLGHLSKENNYPPLAMASFRNEIVMKFGEEAFKRMEVKLTKENGISVLREI